MNNAEEEDLSHLIREIEEAFGALPIPSDDELVVDNSGYHLECNQIQARFRGRHWMSLSIEDLSAEPDSLAFLTNKAFRFFLPAFIKVSLLDPERADIIPDNVLHSLGGGAGLEWSGERAHAIIESARDRGIPDKVVEDLMSARDPSLTAVHHERLQELTVAQRRAVLNFVRFLKLYRSDEFTPEQLSLAEKALEA